MISSQVLSQEYLTTIYFHDSLINLREPPSSFVVFTYKYKSDTVYYSGLPYLIKPPSNYKQNGAFGFIQFEEHGWKSIPSHTLFFIDNYSSESPSIYFDQNFNLDFSDDIQFRLTDIDGAEVELVNKDNKNIKVKTKLNKIVFKDKIQENRVESFANHDIPISINNELLPARYWITELRYNYKSAKGFEDLGLMDWNNNGRFNDYKYDKILVSDSIGKKVNDRNNVFRFDLGKDSVINFRGTKYSVIEIDSMGSYLTLKQTKNQSLKTGLIVLRNGITMPNFEYRSYDNQQLTWEKVRPKDKYILIDFWGTWCNPCLSQTSDLIKLKKEHIEKLEILGLAYQENKQKAIEYVKEKKLDWMQGFASESLVTQFQIVNFPYYVLMDSQGTILSVNENLKEIEKKIE
jgi:thiol-disulfide isomerase/thioredoxin